MWKCGISWWVLVASPPMMFRTSSVCLYFLPLKLWTSCLCPYIWFIYNPWTLIRLLFWLNKSRPLKVVAATCADNWLEIGHPITFEKTVLFSNQFSFWYGLFFYLVMVQLPFSHWFAKECSFFQYLICLPSQIPITVVSTTVKAPKLITRYLFLVE